MHKLRLSQIYLKMRLVHLDRKITMLLIFICKSIWICNKEERREGAIRNVVGWAVAVGPPAKGAPNFIMLFKCICFHGSHPTLDVSHFFCSFFIIGFTQSILSLCFSFYYFDQSNGILVALKADFNFFK